MDKQDLQKVRDAVLCSAPMDETQQNEALAILDAALARDEKPVAWTDEFGNVYPLRAKEYSPVGKYWKPLYLHPSSDAKDAALAEPADDSVVWHSVGELEQAIKDAARFRFMQENQSIKFWDGLAKLQSGEWGEYIDAAMGGKP